MSKTPLLNKTFRSSNRFLFCSLQTYVNTLAGKEVNSSYPAGKFSLHLSARLMFKSCRASDAISTADFRKRLLVSINIFYCVIDRHIIRSMLITLLESSNNCTPLFKFLHFVEYEEKKNKIADFFWTIRRSISNCTTKPVGKILGMLAIVFEAMAFKAAFCSPFNSS